MEIIIGVENFGKIERAEIALGKFTLFVGNNNSGKTFMMQLMYGVLKVLSQMEVTDKGIVQKEDYEEYGPSWIEAWEKQVNTYLNEKKEQIVADIFHNPVGIEKLYIKFTDVKQKYRCHFRDWDYETLDFKDEEDTNAVIVKRKGIAVETEVRSLTTDHVEEKGFLRFQESVLRNAQRKIVRRWIKNTILGWGNPDRDFLLFLPASRTGLLLLYKYFFAEKDKINTENIGLTSWAEEKRSGRGKENDLGLSAPVYDFLQFLLRYSFRGTSSMRNKELLHFVEEHLLEGKLNQIGDETYYISKDAGTQIPLYLSSSLINELAPIVKALSGVTDYKCIFYDEVETCLHPLKQGEMARLLIRLVNSGKRMIVSTHSDTMAAKINNLLILSKLQKDDGIQKKLAKLGLSEKDLLQDAKVHVYQFSNEANGKSIARELEFRTTPLVGYDFELFNDNLEKLFQESGIVLE